ncbi:uncharacterized protein [Ptychodera flava]|uniref:uncharacterized protein n=1 Tax=Ptychodera flava TaxID=63121 RepID=UPI00396A3700
MHWMDVSSANAGGKQAEEADVIKSDVPLESVETGTQATKENTKANDPLLEKERTGDKATEEETKVSDPKLGQERTDDHDTADTMMQKKASPNVFKPSYEQLIKILKVRYYKFHGCKNCKIHGLMKEG